MFQFRTLPGSSLSGYLTYSKSEYSFSFDAADEADLAERMGEGRRTSLVIDTLQLETDADSGAVLYAWGYFPAQSWVPARLPVPPAAQARVSVEADPPLEEAVSVPVWRGQEFAVEHDEETGWIRVSRSPSGAGAYAEIASGVVLQLVEGELSAVWLHPHIAE
ncbi:hypothetical protein [Streptomyces sp. 8L]|uniref:hypothetical protein n=1 Tax=Streptomyces sp. 8L TaxID=2877242 RepID=UPI001CD25168|nr:hypothetical protein [Streptomyces sp. 8L]MCA1222806.1 hypothetical protein [Streptomyces sp. 8L]